jgi:deoxycytidylate deaminase
MFSHFTRDLHKGFMGQAEQMRSQSDDTSTQVGAIIVNRDMEITGHGANKLPFEINDRTVEMFQDRAFLDYFNAQYNLTGSNVIKPYQINSPILLKDFFNSRPYKHMVMQHAERNAIADAAKRGKSTKDSAIYATLYPCVPCTNLIIDAGIKLLVVPHGPDYSHPRYGPKWGLDWKTAEKFLELAKVETLILGR